MLLNFTSQKNRGVDINNFAAFLLICANPIAWVGKGGVLPIICGISLFLIFFANRRITLSTFFLIGISLVAFLFSSLLKENFENSYFRSYYTTFFSLGLTAFLCGQMPIDEYKVIKIISVFAILYFPFLLTIDMGNVEVDSIDYGKWMGISYGILRLLDSLIIISIFSKAKSFRILGLIGSISYLIFLIIYGSRGALLSILLFGFLLFVIKKEFSKRMILKIGCICLIPLTLIIIYFKEILLFIDNFSSKIGIHVFFAEKMLRLIENGNSLSSGRDTLTKVALDGIMQSPLIGNGIATFEPYNSGYVHNIFLQVFYELGIVPFLILTILLVYVLNYIFTRNNGKETRIFFSFLISAGFIELLFSSSLWLSQIFWFLIGYTIKIKFQKNNVKNFNSTL